MVLLMRFFGMVTIVAVLAGVVAARALERPWIGAVFFYWYEWDENAQWGNWIGGVHNTPLYGYYDNRKLQDNLRSLLIAADWGMTHFFLDYWGYDWRGENDEPRETTILRAAEKVRALGYPIFIGYYQDGTNFAMREFWRNISERRDTYRWLRDYARSPVWTWLLGKPFQMIYVRNGIPELTIDHEGFQAWLKGRYGTVDKLNAEWGTNFRSFSDIRMDFNAIGFQRAMSIAYQFERWQQDWAKLEQLIRDELGLPGLRASFDAAYAPFRGFGFERFARVFGGPHSYGGIFGVPHEQDAQRFLQAAVAKKCGTIFFDHLKHCYFDWNIRVPGTAYPYEPHHYDRFWVGNLMRFVDGVLHMSWNEWWEGSNLEPSMEGGKRFCETNLLYSTIWQLAHRDMRQRAVNADIGLLINDWIFEHGGGDADDLYNAVQGLRAINAPFESVLQSEATLENLKRFRVLVAPSGGVGFGFNGNGERIERVLEAWLKLGRRMLITSGQFVIEHTVKQGAISTRRRFDSPRGSQQKFNFFVDIGMPNDKAVLVHGFSFCEDWGKLPQGAFGAGSQATVRWIPSVGNATAFLLPALPKNSLLLRFHGSAIWRNRLTVSVNGQRVDEIVIEPKWHVYDVHLPANVIGEADVIEVEFKFAETHIPGEKEPQRFRGEQRVCNFALDWVQISTADVVVGERKGIPWQPKEMAQFVKPLSGTFRVPLHHRRVRLPKGKVISTYADGIHRDLLLVIPSPYASVASSFLLVNGIFTDDPRWWMAVLEQMAKVTCGKSATLANRQMPDQPELMSAILSAGMTKFLLVENRSNERRKLRLNVPAASNLPLAEIVALSRDGDRFVSLPTTSSFHQLVTFTDTVRYYSVYQVVYAPVRLTMPNWLAFPGQKTRLPIGLQNLTDKPLTITLQLGAVIASVSGEPLTVQLKPKEQKKVTLPVEVEPFADWGMKTVFVKVSWSRGGGVWETAYLLRPLTIGRNANVHCLTVAVTSHMPAVTIANSAMTPFGNLTWWHPARDVQGETARDVEIALNLGAGVSLPEEVLKAADELTLIKVGDLRDGEQKQVRLPLPFCPSPFSGRFRFVIRWRDSSGVHERTQILNVAMLPKWLPNTRHDQVATIIVSDAEMAHGLPLSADLPAELKGKVLVVRLPDGTPLPTYMERVLGADGSVRVSASQKRKPSKRVETIRLHFVLPPQKPSLRVDIGTEGDERVLVHGFSHRETWSSGTTIRWLPGEGQETVLRLPCEPTRAHYLRLHGQAFWNNAVSIYADGNKVGSYSIGIGWQTLTIRLPGQAPQNREMIVRIIFHQLNVPAEKAVGSKDKRVCNFALDWLSLEPVVDEQPLLLALCEATPADIPTTMAVEVGNGIVRVDNGVLELEWNEDAGGTLTKLCSKVTGRNYAAYSFGAGIGTFGRFTPSHPAVNTAQFVVDDFIWQRNSKAKVRIVEQNPVWVTVETTACVDRFKATQRYRVFAGLPLVELSTVVEITLPSSAKSPDEIVALEGRFNAQWWTKSFPNFVGLGDKPPEVYGQLVHFGWRMGEWVPPVLCLFNSDDLIETLSLLIAENDGANCVRQGFWGEQRGKATLKRCYATVELIAKPPQAVRLRLWLLLHEGHHAIAVKRRNQLLFQQELPIVMQTM
ncbi:MAG: beta-galactosidase [Armatimonadetes bacterium]|nr:beta-galactosidase [Armatimonadota bacterium]